MNYEVRTTNARRLSGNGTAVRVSLVPKTVVAVVFVTNTQTAHAMGFESEISCTAARNVIAIDHCDQQSV